MVKHPHDFPRLSVFKASSTFNCCILCGGSSAGKGFFRIYALFCFFIFCKHARICKISVMHQGVCIRTWEIVCVGVCVCGCVCVCVCMCLCVWVSERFCLCFPPQVTEVLQVVLMSSSQICSLISKNSWKVFRCLQTFPPRAKRNTERG